MDDFSPHNSDYPNDSYVKVRRGKVESVDLYEIKDSELDILEQGTPATLQLNFAIFLFSTAFTSIGALATATFNNDITKNAFLFVSIIGILLGLFLLISWLRNRMSAQKTIKRIRDRIRLSNGNINHEQNNYQVNHSQNNPQENLPR